MLYAFLKIVVRLAALVFCRKFVINNRKILHGKGPLLIASNHPNSFLDAVIIDILFRQPVYSLTRGDAFFHQGINKVFRALKMLPVYRTREGVENLSENYKTFEACIAIFRKRGLVSIFSEGLCVSEWHLRPMKKGTARLAFKCWENDIPLKILPLGINYSSFRRFGKNIFINAGSLLEKKDFEGLSSEGTRHQAFNMQLETELRKLVFEIHADDTHLKEEKLITPISTLKKIYLFIPGSIGYLVHLPLYLPVKVVVLKKFGKGVHYDSMLLAALLFSYPFYLLAIIALLFIIIKSWWVFALIVLLPFTAWSFVQVRRKQLDT